MNWTSIDAMLAMGGYGTYVWGSLGMVALVVAVEVALVSGRWRRALAKTRRLSARDAA